MRNDSFIGDYAVNLDASVAYTGPVLTMQGAVCLGIHVYSVGSTNMTTAVQGTNFDGQTVPMPAGIPWLGAATTYLAIGTNANAFLSYPIAVFAVGSQPTAAQYARLVFTPQTGSVGRFWCAVNVRRAYIP